MHAHKLRPYGFTLIELLVVLVVISTLLTIAVPHYLKSVDRSRDAALRQTLAATRDAIDKFHGDTGLYPETLQELVTKRYLRRMPYDPVVESDAGWVIVARPDTNARSEVYDVKSGAPGQANDGSQYADW